MFCEVILVGNVGRDPELRYTPDGTAVCNFSLAVNRSWTDRKTEEKTQETTWWRVAVWGGQAETVNQYVTKGKLVLVRGDRVSSHAWIDKDGTPRAGLELTANTVRFLGGRGGEEDEYSHAKNEENYGYTNDKTTDVDDIPF